MPLNKQQLEVVNQANFPDNNTKFITPALLRDFNTDMIDAIQLTGSYATTGSNTFVGNQTITGDLNVSGVISASVLHVQYETASVIFSTGSNQLGDELTDIQTLSGSVKIQGQLLINGVPLTSGSQVDTGSLVTTASFNQYTQSTDLRLTSLETNSASVNVSISNLNTTTASLNTSITNLNSFSASQKTLNGTFATTGSNTFTGNQIIDRASKLYTNGIYWTDVTAGFNNLEIINQGGGNLDFASLNGGRMRVVNTPLQLTGSTLSSNSDISTSANVYGANLTASAIPAGTISSSAQISALGFVSSSITASSIITASVNNDDITFTKGDGSQFTIQVATGSFAISSSYAETASLANDALDIIVDVKNTTGAQINKGTVVRIIGATGDNPLIGTASWTNDANSANTLGFVVTDIANDAFGRVMTQGTLLGMNTDPVLGYTAGQLVYLSSSGQFTNVKPPAPFHEVRLGQVLRAQQNNGSIYVLVQNGYELEELHDVDINTGSLANNNLLAWNSATLQWENKTVTEVGATTTASFNSYTSSTNNRLTNIESTTASLNSSVSQLNASSASQQISIDNLNAATSSYITESETASFARTNVDNNFTANQTFTNITAVSASFTYVQTLYETASVIYSSGSNQFGDELTDVQTLSGSVKVQGSLTVNGTPVLTSSVDISGLVTTASFNSYTQSNDQRVSSLEVNSASVNTSISALNTFTASQSTASLVTSIDNLNQFSASTLTSLSNLNTATSSLFTSASLALTTASVSGQTMTFTKGDGTTFNVTLPAGSGSVIDTGSFATTGSNSFNGSQIITGSITTTQDITVSGVKFGFGNPAGTSSIAIGNSNTLQNNIAEGPGNIAIGNESLQQNTTGRYNIGIGAEALRNVRGNSNGNTAIGAYALNSVTQSTNTFALGQSAMEFAETSNENIAIGVATLYRKKANSNNNTAIGSNALREHYDGDTNSGQNMAFGLDAMRNVTSGSGNTAIGGAALRDASRANENVFIGWIAGINTSQNAKNTVIGARAGQKIAGENNSLIGHQSGQELTSGSNNTFVGANSGYYNGDASNNTFIGAGSGVNVSGSLNTIIGRVGGEGNWNNVIAIGDGGGNLRAIYNNGWVFTSSVNIENTLTASLQEGYVWVGNSAGRTVTVSTSSFGGALPSGLLSSSVTNFVDYSASVDSRINGIVTGTGFATTGSNTFVGNQTINKNGAEYQLIDPSIPQAGTTSIGISSASGGLIFKQSGSVLIEGSAGQTGLVFYGTGSFNRGIALSDSDFVAGATVRYDTTNDVVIIEKDGTFKPSLNIEGGLTASLEQGYVWVGNASGRTVTVATSSFGGGGTGFATTGSNQFFGSQTIDGNITAQSGSIVSITGQASDGRVIMLGHSGSLVLSNNVSTATYAALSHITSSQPNTNTNLIFKTNSNTGTTIVSGSSNIFVNPTTPAAGRINYIGGTSNLFLNGQTQNLPQITGSAASVSGNRPTMNGNIINGTQAWSINQAPNTGLHTYSNNILGGAGQWTFNTTGNTGTVNVNHNLGLSSFMTLNSPSRSVAQINAGESGSNALTIQNNTIAGALNYNGPVSSSTHTIQQNSIAGTLNFNVQSGSRGLNAQANIINGLFTLNDNTVFAPTLGSTSTIAQNNINGTTLFTNAGSSSFNITNNNLNSVNVTSFLDASAVTAAPNRTSVLSANAVFGNNNFILFSGSQGAAPTGRTVSVNLIAGQFISASLIGDGSGSNMFATAVLGGGLNVIGTTTIPAAGIQQNYGSAFFGRWNAEDGNRARTAQTIFAVGTGTSGSAGITRKTGFLIDSGSNTYFEGSLNVSGSTTMTGSLTIQSGSGDLYMYGHKMFSVASFSSTITQSGSAAVSQSITFNTTDISEGVTLNGGGTQMIVANAGIYNIQFSAQLLSTTGGDDVYIWLKKNGTNITYTGSRVTLANNDELVVAGNFLQVAANANDYFEICWQNLNGHAELLTEVATGNIPGIPSVIATVTQVR